MPYAAPSYDQWTKYFVTRDTNFDSLTLDLEPPCTWATRISTLSSLQDINQSDLSAFMNKGGKLLIAHGTADALISSRATAQYVERVKTSMGEAKMNSFFPLLRSARLWPQLE